MNFVSSSGYELSYYYTFGELDQNNTGFGWVGNQSELTASQVIDRISIIKSGKSALNSHRQKS